MLSKVVSSSIFKVFGMTRPGIELRSPGPLANTLGIDQKVNVLVQLEFELAYDEFAIQHINHIKHFTTGILPSNNKSQNIHIFKRFFFRGGGPRDVMVKAMDCGIVVSEFVFQSRYYVHFRANTFGKGMNPLILPAMG